MNYFCTLFNANYLLKGLAMISSLERNARQPFQIYVLAMDDETLQVLRSLNQPCVIPMALADFENADLLKVKEQRSFVEYCWTCTPAVIRYAIQNYKLPECTYLDADLFFLNDPSAFLDEVKTVGKSVLITPHNYSLFFDQTKRSGIFCVQFMYFKNDSSGFKVLENWYQECLAWCYSRVEDGKFGDQKYLDVWPQKFPVEVHSLVHHGALAPWNIHGVRLKKMGELLEAQKRQRKFSAILYHFHGFQLLKDGGYFNGWYPLSDKTREFIYGPYVQEIEIWKTTLQQTFGPNLQALTGHDSNKPVNKLKALRVKLFELLYGLAF